METHMSFCQRTQLQGMWLRNPRDWEAGCGECSDGRLKWTTNTPRRPFAAPLSRSTIRIPPEIRSGATVSFCRSTSTGCDGSRNRWRTGCSREPAGSCPRNRDNLYLKNDSVERPTLRSTTG